MLDLLGIMVSSIMMVIVIARAAQLDRTTPWFETPADPNAPKSGIAKVRERAARSIPAWRRPHQ
jgi:hypothetical protein